MFAGRLGPKGNGVSDTVVKLIPKAQSHRPPVSVHAAALEAFVRIAPGCEDPLVRSHESLQYVDAGENEEAATCPSCRRRLIFDWSAEHEKEMHWYNDIVHATEGSAEGIRTRMPCCDAEVPFADVAFDWSGFALFELAVSNPDVDFPLEASSIASVEAIAGCALRQIWARY